MSAKNKILLDGSKAEGIVTIPADVTCIDDGAFSENANLTEVIMTDGVTKIGKEAFKGCKGLKKVVMSDTVIEVGEYAFNQCTSLEDVTLSKELTVISDQMFSQCDALKSIVIPEKVNTIGNSAFWFCKSLENVKMPSSLKTLGASSFAACSVLTTFTIPAGITEVPVSLLGSCHKLETVIIPDSIEKIQSSAFQYCELLKYILFTGNTEQWNKIEGTRPEGPKYNTIILYKGTQLGDQENDAPKIVEQPVDGIYKKGEDATKALHVKADQLKEKGTTYYFNWKKNTVKSIEGGTSISSTLGSDGVSSSVLPDTTVEGNTYYYCIVEKVKEDGTITYTCSDIVTIAVATNDFVGSGTEENPYQLSTAMELQKLKELVENGNDMSGIYFKMTDDITLPNNWEPIGKTIDGTENLKNGENLRAFSGIFDGNNKTLTVPKGGRPLLNYVKGAEVRNLNIYGEKIAGHGLVDNLAGVGLSGSAIVLDHVTLKKGSSTLKSGLLGTDISVNIFAGCSAAFVVTIRNCTIEEGVVVGYAKDQEKIGGIVGAMQGTIENCVSHATVYGKNYVGGILGTLDNALGVLKVSGCSFDGTVEASGEHVGGIVGGGYWSSSAPNGKRINILNCTASGKITGADKVGGILGGDSYVAQLWAPASVKGNSFTGVVNATKGVYKGGIIGFYDSLNVYDDIMNNYYSKECGADRGIGFVKYIDTNCATHETESGAIYFNTEKDTSGCPEVTGCWWNTGLNRVDDPMGVDTDKLASSTTEVQKYVTELKISGDYKKEFNIGNELDLTGIVVKAVYNDGTEQEVALEDVEIKGFDNKIVGEQTLTLSYEGARAEITVKVLRDKGTISVSFQLLGDKLHGAGKESHTFISGNLTEWIAEKTYEVDSNATVYDLLKTIEAATEGFKILERYNDTYQSTYIYGIEFGGIRLDEFDNGANSGWMYTVNGQYKQVGVTKQYLEDGDEVVFHYTDDYTVEKDKIVVTPEAVIAMIDAIGTVTLQSETKIKEARVAYDALSDDQKAAVTNYDILIKAEEEFAKLKKELMEELEAIDVIYKTTGDYLENIGTPSTGSIGGEWMVLGLLRSGRSVSKAYYDTVVKYVKENINAQGQLHRLKSTENSRIIVALTAAGYDVTNVAGHNLLQALSSFDFISKQGFNGTLWALIALDTYNYEIPLNKDTADQTTREKIIDDLLGRQLADGGWALKGEKADTDMTAMTMQALAPYYKKDAKVKAALDKAVECLSKMQNEDGSYSTMGDTTSESIAQVIVALTALGINPHTDSRFIKNGVSVVQALCAFYVEGGGFKHLISGERDGMATEQGYYALVSYARFLKGQTSLYDMSDVKLNADEIIKPEDPDKKPTNPDTKTGDETPIEFLTVAALFSFFACAVLVMKKKKGEHF